MMNAIERALFERPPLEEAAAFFVKLKTAAPEDGMLPPAQEPMGQGAQMAQAAPDTTGQLEGEFTVPVEQVLPIMAAIVENEFKTMLAYHVYAESLRGLEREGIAEEFEEHAEQEVEHAEFLLRRMAVLGGPIQLQDIPAPVALTEAAEIVQTMVTLEQEGIAKWRELHSMLGDNPTRFKVEEFLTREQHHLDELWQLLPWDGQSAQPAPGVGAGAGAPLPASNQTTNSAVQASDKEPAPAAMGPVSVKVGSVKLGGPSVGFLKTVAQPAAAAAQKAHRAAAAAVDTDKAKGVKRVGELLSGDRVDRFRNALNKNRGAGWPYKHLYHHEVGEEALREAGRVSKARAGAAGAAGVAAGAAAAHGKGEKEKAASMKQAFERIAPDTARYHSSRMLAVLEALPGRVYYAEEEKTASARFRAGISKVADLGGAVAGPAVASLQQPAGAFEGTPDIQGYLTNETSAQQAEEQGSAQFYQQRFQQAAEQLKQLQETQAQLEQQLQGSEQQIQTAMQAAQSAQSTATQAMQAQLTSADDALKNRSLATSMRQAYQTLRGQMMDIAGQDPAAQVGAELNGSAAAAAQVPGQAPGQVPGQAGGQVGGQPGGGAGESGGAPTSGAPTGDTGPAGQAPGAASAPGAAPPEGETGAQNQANSSGTPGADRSTASPSTHVSIKTSGVMDSALVGEAKKRLPYAIAGGALGAGAGALEARAGSAGPRAKVKELGERPGSFGNAMQQASAKFRLALAEAGEEHPGAATLAGGLAGAALGAGAGPALHQKVRNVAESAKEIREAV